MNKEFFIKQFKPNAVLNSKFDRFTINKQIYKLKVKWFKLKHSLSPLVNMFVDCRDEIRFVSGEWSVFSVQIKRYSQPKTTHSANSTSISLTVHKLLISLRIKIIEFPKRLIIFDGNCQAILIEWYFTNDIEQVNWRNS